MGIFIPINVKQALIDEYIHIDITETNKAIKFAKKQDLLTQMGAIRFAIYYDVNQMKEMVAFIKTEGLTLFGFNNSRYDDVLLDYLVCNYTKLSSKTTIEICNTLKDASDNIIDVGRNYYRLEPSLFKYKHTYTSYDVLNSLFETVERKPLKQFAILLRWYRIQDLPYHHTTWLEKGLLEEVSDYCVNDVLITREVFKLRAEEFKNKIGYSKTYGIDLTNKNRSSIADALLFKFYSEATGLTYYQLKDKRTYRSRIKFSELIDPRIEYSTPELQAFKQRIADTTLIVGADTFSENVVFKGVKYSLGVGGIHSVDSAGKFETTEDEELIDVDGDSYYPITLTNLKIYPEHLQQVVFNNIVYTVTHDRIAAKKRGDTTIANALKIVVNATFGKFGYENGWLYDLAALYKTTINCQLALLKLIELFAERDIFVISANTDGVTCKVKKEQKESYMEACETWCKLLSHTVEYTYYDKYVRLSVNDYLATYASKPDKKPKRKGDFRVELDLTKGYGMPIVSKALNEFYLNNVPIEDTIRNINGKYDVYDYCLTQNIDKGYKTEIHSIAYDEKGNAYRKIEEIQHTVRYIATTKGDILMKQEITGKLDNKTGKLKPKKLISVVAKQYITVFNTFFPVNTFEEYNIDYPYYISKAREMIFNIDGVTTKLMKKHTGGLFDTSP